MCVILAAIGEQRPTKEMVEKAWDRNSHGGGVAYRETDKDGKAWVQWEKNLSKDDMLTLCEEMPLPYIAHFRVASSGGRKPELCHPFEVSEGTPPITKGMTDGFVFFQNGDWGEWRKAVIECSLTTGVRIPPGPWSDTRAMAWLMSIMGHGFIDFIDQKGVAFGPTDMEFFTGSGWFQINGVWCSNNLFWGGVKVSSCRESTCHETGGLDADGRCSKHRKRHPVDPTTSADEMGEEGTDAKEVGTALMKMPVPQDRVIQVFKGKKKRNAGPGGGQPKTPFPQEILALMTIGRNRQALWVAENMHRRFPKRLSKNQLKRVRIQVTGTALTPDLSDFSAWDLADQRLKDPRFEPVTVH